MSFGIPVRNGLGVGLLASTTLSTRRGGSVFTPASLFTAGESGYWLDPSDFTTVWQDSQGVTPVTATGQTCGLILDKRIGTRTQVFSDANVTFFGTAGYANRISSGVYDYARDPSLSGSVVFGGLVTGRAYLISVQIAAYGGPIPGIVNISVDFRSALNVQMRPLGAVAGTYTVFYVADGATFRIGAGGSNSGGTISNVSILEVAGNHFLQATAGNRPILGVEPAGGRRNLLLQTGLTGATSGTPGTVPTGWTSLASGGTTTVIPGGGSLGGDAIRLSATANRQVYVQTTTTLAASSTYTFSVQCIVHTSLSIISFANLSAPPAGTTLEYLIDGVVVPSGTALPLGPCTVAVRATTSTTAGTSGLRLGIGTGGNATGDVTFWDPQFELGSTRTAYQRVTDQWNVTQAGVTPCYYVAFDGTDDGLVSAATINPGAVDKAQVFAGARKLSDAGVATLVEASTQSSNFNGSFGVFAPRVGTTANYGTHLRGTVTSEYVTPSSFVAPVTNVVSGLYDIALATATEEQILRVNGVAQSLTAVNGTVAGPSGTGNFLTYTHYIGRRGGTTLPFNGRVYQMVMRYGANLTSDQITQTETFVNSKTGAY